jgi:hypothetical protein
MGHDGRWIILPGEKIVQPGIVKPDLSPAVQEEKPLWHDDFRIGARYTINGHWFRLFIQDGVGACFQWEWPAGARKAKYRKRLKERIRNAKQADKEKEDG